jgi:hypothetical protein
MRPQSAQIAAQDDAMTAFRPTRARLASALLILTLLAGCATAARVDAAGDVHAFLVSIRNDDREAFERHVDRPALKAQIESRLLQMGQGRGASQGVRALSALLAQPAADIAGDALVQPRVFRAGAEYLGYRPTTPIPGRLAITSALKYRPDGRVCVVAKKAGDCLFVFTDEDGTWKLTGFEGGAADLRGVLR